MLDVHIARGAGLTVAAIEVPIADARRFGVLEVDEDSRVVGFQEKPEAAAATPWNPGFCLGSMGVYIFDTELLVRELQRDAEEDTSHDFGRDIIPRLVQGGERVYAYLFWDENKKESKYWRDVGTLDAYYEATMDLIQVDPVFNLYDPDWPMRTYQPQFPPAKFVFSQEGRLGHATDSIVSMGCIVSGSEVRRSVLSPERTRPFLLRHPGLHPPAPQHRPPAQPHPAGDRGPRRRDPAGGHHRLRPGGGPAAAHRHRRGDRGRHSRRGMPGRPQLRSMSRAVLISILRRPR